MPEEIKLKNPCEGCINKPEEVLMLRFCNKMCDKYQQYQSDLEAFNKLKAELEVSQFHNQFHIEVNEKLKAEISQLKEDKKQMFSGFRKILRRYKVTIHAFDDLNKLEFTPPKGGS